MAKDAPIHRAAQFVKEHPTGVAQAEAAAGIGISATSVAAIGAAKLGVLAGGAVLGSGAGLAVPGAGVLLAADAARRAYNRGQEIQRAQAERTPDAIRVGSNPDLLYRNFWHRLTANVGSGIAGHERTQSAAIRGNEEDVSEIYDAAEALDYIFNLAPDEQMELLQKLLDPETGDRSHNSDIAVHAIISALERSHRVAAIEQSIAAEGLEIQMGEVEGRAISGERARQERRTKYAADVIAGVTPTGEFMSQAEVDEAKFKVQREALRNMHQGVQALVDPGAELEIRRELADDAFNARLGTPPGLTWFERQRFYMSKGLRDTLGAWRESAKIRYNLGGAAVALVDSEVQDRVTKLISEQRDLVGGAGIRDEITRLSTEAGNLRHLVEDGNTPPGIIAAADLMAKNPGWRNDRTLNAELVLQDEYNETSATIARYHRENKEYFEAAETSVIIADKDVDIKLQKDNPELVEGHRRYSQVHDALVDMNNPKKAGLKAAEKYIIAEQTRADRVVTVELAADYVAAQKVAEDRERQRLKLPPGAPVVVTSRLIMDAMPKDLAQRYQDAEKRRAQTGGILASLKTKTPDRRAVFDFLAEDAKQFKDTEADYQVEFRKTKTELSVSRRLTSTEIAAQMPPDYKDAIMRQEKALTRMRAIQAMRERANFVDTEVRCENDPEAQIVIDAISDRANVLDNRNRLKQMELEAEKLEKVNLELVVEWGTELADLKKPPPPPIEDRIQILLAKVAEAETNVQANLDTVQPTYQVELDRLRVELTQHERNETVLEQMADEMAVHKTSIEAEIGSIFGENFLEQAVAMRESMADAFEAQRAVNQVYEQLARNGEVPGGKRRLREAMDSLAEQVAGLGEGADVDIEAFVRDAGSAMGLELDPKRAAAQLKKSKKGRKKGVYGWLGNMMASFFNTAQATT